MFKANERMRPAGTPERVLAVCRIVSAVDKISREEIIHLITLDPLATEIGEPIVDSLAIAVELGFLKKEGSFYRSVEDSSTFATYSNFRRVAAKRAFSMQDSLFFKLSEWVISNDEIVKTLNRYQDVAASASKAGNGLELINDRDVLQWRFWARFLGIIYLYDHTIIPNMKIRLEDALRSVSPGTEMTCTHFIQWLKANIPEAASALLCGTFALICFKWFTHFGARGES